MPNRVIKESIRTSPNLNRLSDAGEVLFYRILTLCDDHGGFEATPDTLRGALFPKKTNWGVKKLVTELVNLTNNDLVRLWVQNERLYGLVVTLHDHQRIRSLHQRRAPEAPESFNVDTVNALLCSFADNCQQVAVNCQQLPAGRCQLQQIDVRKPKPNPNPNPNPKHKPQPQQTTGSIKKDDREKAVEVLKLAFLKKFQSNPYPFYDDDKYRERVFKDLNETIAQIVDRVKGNIDILLDDMTTVAKNGSANVGTLLYFIKSQHGASRWEKLADQVTFEEHGRLKQEWVNALEENAKLKAMAESLVAHDQPEWVQKAIVEYQKLVKKYELISDVTEKQLLKNQILTMQKRFGL